MNGENIFEKSKDNIAEHPDSLEKRIFWHYARKHLEKMRLLFRGGRLSKKEGDWNNVIDHCLVQGAEAGVLASLMSMTEEESDSFQKVAFVHDWNKRLKRRPEDFTQEQRVKAEELLEQVSPDPEILASTEAGFNRRIIDGQASLLQKLMFYIDDITSGSEIVGYQKRIEETRTRTNLDEDAELTKKLGGRFWDVEWLACRLVEEELFALLKAKGVDINLPQDIPQLIRKETIKKVHFPEKEPEKEKTQIPIEIFTEAQAGSEGRLNEDAFAAVENDRLLAIAVLDGATGISTVTGISGPGEPPGGRVAAQFAAVGIEKNYQTTESAAELLLAGNQQIADSLLSCGTNPDKSLPENLSNTQAVLALVKKREGVVEIAQTGDAACLIKFSDGKIELALPLDITPQDIEALEQGRKISREKNISLKEALASETIHKLMVEGRKLCNKRDGTGVGALDGQNSARLYIKTRQFQLSDVAEIIMLTDGLFLPREKIGADPNWVEMARIIDEKGIKGLYQEIMAMKDSDPELNKFPRFKKHDDASVIIVKLSK